MKEVELKLRVDSAEALSALARAAGGGAEEPVLQVNAFFDTLEKSLWREKHIVRLRVEAGRFFLTLKGPQARSESGNLTVTSEAELELSSLDARALKEGRRSPFEFLEAMPDGARPLVEAIRSLAAGRPLVQVGSFENRRTRLRTHLPSDGAGVEVVLELDETHFPGGVVHYEVEVEVDEEDAPAAEAAVLALFARAGVQGRPGPSKSKRFFAALEGKTF